MHYVLKALAGLCLLLFAMLCPNPAGAQTRDSINTRELEEVQVSGSKKDSWRHPFHPCKYYRVRHYSA
ncbi:hypothetical protein [Niabella hibiscisoli]|uniref:hypothetical protein n=1 Tax=Niabella hibiscisoli TaxID=1825928 RepID=UPI001F0E5FD7|nr:hypothetical protein [Niabella hibiscisoli]MCH5716058.1 hypothetical protein [Niabella hibiscisoli]